MKNKFIEGVKIITLGLILGLGVGMVQATPWTYPTGVVPPTNTLPPLSMGTTGQVKAPVYNTTTLQPIDPTLFGVHNQRGALSVGSLAVAAGAQFMKAVNVGTINNPGSLEVYGNKKIANSLTVTSVTNSAICTNTSGKLVACPVASCKGTYPDPNSSHNKYMCTGNINYNGNIHPSCEESSGNYSNEGTDCSTLGLDVSTSDICLSDNSCSCGTSTGTPKSCGCLLDMSNEVPNTLQCSTLTTTTLCGQHPTCTWGI